MDFRNPKKSQSPLVHEDVIEEILSRLPVKSLLRFKCVSKPWRSLISSKRFVETHFRNSTKNTVIFDYGEEIRQCSLQSMLDTSIAPSPVDDPIINQLKGPIILGCCNGLVCIVDGDRDEHFSMWNPSTRIIKELPQVPEINRKNRKRFVLNHGVGRDELSDDYKVFALLWMYESEEIIGKVYSSKTNSWKTIEHIRFPITDTLGTVCKTIKLTYFPVQREEGTFVGGKLHWKKYDSEEKIACFDLKTEVCGKIELPFKAEPSFSCSMMGGIGGCLSLVRDNKVSPTAEVWVMKEYGVKESWSKLVALSHVRELVRPPFSAPFVVGRDGEVLLSFGRFFLVYFPKDNTFHQVTKLATRVSVESLVSP